MADGDSWLQRRWLFHSLFKKEKKNEVWFFYFPWLNLKNWKILVYNILFFIRHNRLENNESEWGEENSEGTNPLIIASLLGSHLS